ncbi:ankyrin repeat domain-containing protein [Micromonospora sp. NPDC049374]|uniref:ankyrin repeat domain-containing protein n=1 Tax=Micromonospora sp. NPDC049374 TaxID=3154352 RepID=UPI00343CBD7C
MNHVANQHLIEAVRAGDGAAVTLALAGGVNPNAEVGRLRAPVLVEAARGGRLDIIGLLVNAGASVGPVGHFNVTPLRVAMLEAHTDVVRHLIAHGALQCHRQRQRPRNASHLKPDLPSPSKQRITGHGRILTPRATFTPQRSQLSASARPLRRDA